MSATSRLRPTVLAALALLIIACRDRSYDALRVQPTPSEYPSGTTTLSAASRVSLEAAIQRLTDARCTREITCGNVGPSRYFGTVDACALSVTKSMRDQLEAENCPSGVDGVALERCIAQLRTDACPDAGLAPQLSVVRRRPSPRSIEALDPLGNCPPGDLCL